LSNKNGLLLINLTVVPGSGDLNGSGGTPPITRDWDEYKRISIKKKRKEKEACIWLTMQRNRLNEYLARGGKDRLKIGAMLDTL
jgi:hypothetical protein